MNEVEKVKQLCKERHVSLHKLEMDLGFANGYISQLKKGYIPTQRLKMISEYFGMPVSYFTGLDDEMMDIAERAARKAFENALGTITVQAKKVKTPKEEFDVTLKNAFWNASNERQKIVCEILGIEMYKDK